MMDNRGFAAWLRQFVGLFGLLGVLALSACGGGAGTPGTNPNVPPPAPGPGPSVLTVQPAGPVTIYAKIPSAVTILGGTAPFSIFSDNTVVLPVPSTLNSNTLNLLATSVGGQTTVNVTVQDAVSSRVTFTVLVNPELVVEPPKLLLLPPTLDAFAGIPTAITVAGGVAPFRAFSSNSAILPVTQNVAGNTIPLLAANVAVETDITITVIDAVGQVATATVTVHTGSPSPPPPLSVLPSTMDLFAGVSTQLTIIGGVAPYRAFSTNPGTLPVTQNVSGNSVPLLANAVAVNTVVTVTIVDAVGQVATATITVHPGTPVPPPPLVVLPSVIDVFVGVPAQLTISGGVPPYRAFSTNPAVLSVTQDVAGNTVPLTPSQVATNTVVTVTIVDSVGQAVNVAVTVHAGSVVPPPPLQVFPTTLDAFAGIPTQLTVAGGVAPYRAFSTNPAVLPVTQDVAGNTVPLLANPVAVNTPVTITILDSVGQVVNVLVTVHAGPASPPPALVVLPATADVYSGIASQLTVTGGVPPYRAFSTNSAILPVTQNVVGNSVPLLAATVTVNTNVTVTIQDSVGQTVTVPVIVHPKPVTPPPALVVQPTTIDAYVGIPTQITVIDGVAPYRAFSTNSAVLPVTENVVNNRIVLVASPIATATNVLITVIDAVGQTVVVTVTVHPQLQTPANPLVVLPTDVVVIPGVSVRLTISGGVEPYRAFSTNSAVLPVQRNVPGNTLLLAANPVTVNTAVIITIQDSVGQTVNVNASVRPAPTVTPPPLVVLPADITVSKGVPFTLTISGGAPPFFAYSSNPGVLPVNLNVPGNSLVLTANGVAVDTDVIVTVQDSAGQTKTVTVHVKADTATPPPTLTIFPSPVTVFSGVPTSLTINGGVPPYQAFSSNSAVLPVAQTVAGTAIPLFPATVAANTTVTITVLDSASKTATDTVTVSPAPLLNSLTISPNPPACTVAGAICSGQTGTAVVTVLLPGGGPAAGRQERFEVISGPYGIAQSGTGATAPSLTVTSDAAGHAQVIIKANVDAPTQFAQLRVTDVASGQQLTGNFLIVQLTDGSTILTVIPPTATIASGFVGSCSAGFKVDYFIYGGTPPYRITQTFPTGVFLLNSIVNESGGFFEVQTNGTCVQPEVFSIVDATGRQTTATLNNLEGTTPIPPPVPVADLSVIPGDISAVCTGATFEFLITGGTQPYNVSASPRIGTSPIISPQVVVSSGQSVRISSVPLPGVTLSFLDSSSPPKSQQRKITCTDTGGGGGGALALSIGGIDYTVPPGNTCVGKTSTFTITGGTPPYAVQFASLAPPVFGTLSTNTVLTSGGSFSVAGLHDTSGGGVALITISITDANSAVILAQVKCP